jgi:hypothetical protein
LRDNAQTQRSWAFCRSQTFPALGEIAFTCAFSRLGFCYRYYLAYFLLVATLLVPHWLVEIKRASLFCRGDQDTLPPLRNGGRVRRGEHRVLAGRWRFACGYLRSPPACLFIPAD